MDLGRAFEPAPLLGSLGMALAAGAYAVVVGRRRGQLLARTLEAAGLALVGALVAATLIGALLDLGDDSREAALFVGWAFFFINGAVDTVLLLFDVQLLTRPPVLIGTAIAVGGLTGGLHGAHRVYPWRGWGAPQFLADITWGLSGSTTGGLLHLVNLGLRARRAPEERAGVNHFQSGLHPPGRNYAFTQGAVLSNLRRQPGEPLYEHEKVHVLQHRLFGPLYTISYVGWMALSLLPAAGIGVHRHQVRRRVEGYCYYSNPWEVWGYRRQRHVAGEPEGGDARHRLSKQCCFSERTSVVVGTPYLVGVSGVLVTLGVLAFA